MKKLDSVRLIFSDLEVSNSPKDEQILSVLESGWLDREYCKPFVFCGPKRTYVVSRVVTGLIDIIIRFKPGTSVSLAGATASRFSEYFGLNDPQIPSNFATSSSSVVRVDTSGDKLVIAFDMKYWRQFLPRSKFKCGRLNELN